jgi:DNA (cytosine-5)-methyltransferase 1
LSKPLLLDLFCGAGGASKGYADAGFDIMGVDIKPQKHYPYLMLIMDALDIAFESAKIAGVKAIHASPPCQYYSYMSACRPKLANKYPDLIDKVRERLETTGLPYVIENVPGAPLRDPVMLCGTMFNKELYRHRLFESNIPILQPDHPAHLIPASKAGHWKQGTIMSVAGHIAPIAHARKIMEIDWMNREELAESIPPYYTRYIAENLFNVL